MRVRHTKTIRISRRNFGMAIENSRNKEQNVRWKNSLWIVTTATVFHFKTMLPQFKYWNIVCVC